MYVPAHFQMTAEQIRQVLGTAPVGYLVSHGPDGLAASWVPMVFEPGANRLLGHLARVNRQWEHAGEVLFLVHGPDAYIPASLAGGRPGAQNPTWNHVSVQIRGELVAHPEPEWLIEALRKLNCAHADPAADDPAGQAGQLRALVGIEVRITEVLGKAKMSQHKSPELVEAQIAELDGSSAAEWMAQHSLPRAVDKARMLAELGERPTPPGV